MTILRELNIVRTSYGTGPYVIKGVAGPCTCPSYLSQLGGDDSPSESHFHLTCRLADQPERGDYWLNGYRNDGTSVWGGDTLTLVGQSKGQLSLFEGSIQ